MYHLTLHISHRCLLIIIVNTSSKNSRHIFSLLLAGICCLILGTASNALAAKPTPTPKPSPTPVLSPTPRPSPTPIATPSPSPTPIATPNPSPTPIASPTPAATPNPSPTPTPIATNSPCPLPITYGITANSPEKPPKNYQSVCHNGMILCLPPSAANAHVQHGDAPLTYVCDGKSGNTGVTCTGTNPGGH